MVSAMLYPCILCVALLVYLFVLRVACLTVFVNYLVKQFAICFGVVAILLLNVMAVFSVGGGALLDRPCMDYHRFCLCFVCRKISSFRSLRAGSQVFALLMLFLCVFYILCLRVRACNCFASCPLVCCACLPSV